MPAPIKLSLGQSRHLNRLINASKTILEHADLPSEIKSRPGEHIGCAICWLRRQFGASGPLSTDSGWILVVS